MKSLHTMILLLVCGIGLANAGNEACSCYRCSFIFRARRTVMPGTLASSSSDASLTPAKEPNRRSNIRFRLGPIPGTESMADLTALLLRRCR